MVLLTTPNTLDDGRPVTAPSDGVGAFLTGVGEVEVDGSFSLQLPRPATSSPRGSSGVRAGVAPRVPTTTSPRSGMGSRVSKVGSRTSKQSMGSRGSRMSTADAPPETSTEEYYLMDSAMGERLRATMDSAREMSLALPKVVEISGGSSSGRIPRGGGAFAQLASGGGAGRAGGLGGARGLLRMQQAISTVRAQRRQTKAELGAQFNRSLVYTFAVQSRMHANKENHPSESPSTTSTEQHAHSMQLQAALPTPPTFEQLYPRGPSQRRAKPLPPLVAEGAGAFDTRHRRNVANAQKAYTSTLVEPCVHSHDSALSLSPYASSPARPRPL